MSSFENCVGHLTFDTGCPKSVCNYLFIRLDSLGISCRVDVMTMAFRNKFMYNY